MVQPARRLAVRTVKPLVSDAVWQRLRGAGRPVLGASPAPASSPEEVERRRLAAMNLTQLGREFRTDKAGIHKYTRHYEHHLRHLRDVEFTLLEIGIGGYSREGQGGASLRMWKQSFPNAKVVGLDIQEKSFVREERIFTYRGSQTDPAVLERLLADVGPETLKVVIDDGSHRPHHIRETFRLLFPRLPDGAIYAIEDCQTSYWPEFGGAEDRHDSDTTMALVKDLVDGLNHEEFVDEAYEPTYTDRHVVAVHAYHNLVFIEKGTNSEGTRRRQILKERYARTDEAGS